MLIEILGAVLLLAVMIVAFVPRKPKTKAGLKIDTDTRFANYAVNANGKLERIHGNSLIND